VAEKSHSQRGWPFFLANWQTIVAGLVLGAVLGFAFPTVVFVGSRLAKNVPQTIKSIGEVTVWPKRGFATICVVLSVGVVFYAIRSYAFLKKLWASLRSGLVSGIGVI
jgi:hypothetical protein